jgi:hypothetical protein
MAAFRLPWIIGNTKFQDNIGPSIFPGGATPTGPVGLTFEQVMAIKWRVKKWSYVISGSMAIDPSTPHTVGFDLTSTAEFYKPDFVTKADQEIDLISQVFNNGPAFSLADTFDIMGSSGVILSPTPVGVITGPTPMFTSFQLSADLGLSFDGALYYPNLFFEARDGVAYSDTGVGVTSNTGGLPVGFHTIPSPALVIDPVVVPSFTIPMFALTFTITPISSALSLRLTATEFWPYADSNGNPIYDTATGAQLTDPLG